MPENKRRPSIYAIKGAVGKDRIPKGPGGPFGAILGAPSAATPRAARRAAQIRPACAGGEATDVTGPSSRNPPAFSWIQIATSRMI